jgi:hypothetical protein
MHEIADDALKGLERPGSSRQLGSIRSRHVLDFRGKDAEHSQSGCAVASASRARRDCAVAKELRRMKQVTDATAFDEFAAVHRQAIWEEFLAPVREARGEPTWRPTGFMEGMGFQAQVSTILRERFELSQHHGQK